MAKLSSSDLFTGKLVRMAALMPEDRTAFALWSNDSEFLRLLDSTPARPRRPDYFAWSDKQEWRKEEWRHFDFSLRTLADDKLIGFVELEVDWPNRAGVVGIGIGERAYQSKGYGSDALRVLLGYAFRELNLYRVGLNVFSYNTRAIRAYEKVGFTHEGTLRAALYRDGQHYDLLYMSVLRPEWFAQMGLEDE
jgi:RimJ/RimL family protein N-acetyltransferase